MAQKTQKQKPLPEWLPDNVKEYAIQQQALAKTTSNEVWLLAEQVFFSSDVKNKVWGWLKKKSPDAPRAFAEAIVQILHENALLRQGYKDQQQQNKLMKKSLAAFLKIQKTVNKIDGILSAALLQSLIKDLRARIAGYEYMEKNICESKSVFGLGRQACLPKNHPASFAIRLVAYMRENFDNPTYKVVTETTNAIFGTTYSEDGITSLCSQRKR